jgi:hypothetical protein
VKRGLEGREAVVLEHVEQGLRSASARARVRAKRARRPGKVGHGGRHRSLCEISGCASQRQSSTTAGAALSQIDAVIAPPPYRSRPPRCSHTPSPAAINTHRLARVVEAKEQELGVCR